MYTLCEDPFFEKGCFYVFEMKYFPFLLSAGRGMERQGDSPHDHAFVELPVPSMLSVSGEADLQVLIRETEEKLKLNACRSVARAVTCPLQSLCLLKRKLELSLLVQWPEGLALLLSPPGPCMTRHTGSSCLVQSIHMHTYSTCWHTKFLSLSNSSGRGEGGEGGGGEKNNPFHTEPLNTDLKLNIDLNFSVFAQRSHKLRRIYAFVFI